MQRANLVWDEGKEITENIEVNLLSYLASKSENNFQKAIAKHILKLLQDIKALRETTESKSLELSRKVQLGQVLAELEDYVHSPMVLSTVGSNNFLSEVIKKVNETPNLKQVCLIQIEEEKAKQAKAQAQLQAEQKEERPVIEPSKPKTDAELEAEGYVKQPSGSQRLAKKILDLLREKEVLQAAIPETRAAELSRQLQLDQVMATLEDHIKSPMVISAVRSNTLEKLEVEGGEKQQGGPLYWNEDKPMIEKIRINIDRYLREENSTHREIANNIKEMINKIDVIKADLKRLDEKLQKFDIEFIRRQIEKLSKDHNLDFITTRLYRRPKDIPKEERRTAQEINKRETRLRFWYEREAEYARVEAERSLCVSAYQSLAVQMRDYIESEKVRSPFQSGAMDLLGDVIVKVNEDPRMFRNDDVLPAQPKAAEIVQVDEGAQVDGGFVITVKAGEKITWAADKSQVENLQKNLKKYLSYAEKRHTDSHHLALAKRIQEKLNVLVDNKDNHAKYYASYEEFSKYMSKLQVKKFGLLGKKSYLFTLVQTAKPRLMKECEELGATINKSVDEAPRLPSAEARAEGLQHQAERLIAKVERQGLQLNEEAEKKTLQAASAIALEKTLGHLDAEFRTLSEESTTAKATIKKQSQALEKAEAAVQEAETQNAAAQAEAAKAKKELEDERSYRHALTKQVDHGLELLVTKDEEIEDLTAELAEAREAIKDHEVTDSAVQALQKELAKRDAELLAAQKAVEKLSGELTAEREKTSWLVKAFNHLLHSFNRLLKHSGQGRIHKKIKAEDTEDIVKSLTVEFREKVDALPRPEPAGSDTPKFLIVEENRKVNRIV